MFIQLFQRVIREIFIICKMVYSTEFNSNGKIIIENFEQIGTQYRTLQNILINLVLVGFYSLNCCIQLPPFKNDLNHLLLQFVIPLTSYISNFLGASCVLQCQRLFVSQEIYHTRKVQLIFLKRCRENLSFRNFMLGE